MINNINTYNFNVFHIKGKKNTFSDYLSRTQELKNVPPNDETSDKNDSPLVICSMEEDDMTRIVNYDQLRNLDIKTGQSEDNEIQDIFSWVEENFTPTEADLKDKSVRFKRLAAIMYKIRKEKDIVGVKKEDYEVEIEDFRPIIPKQLETQVVEMLHEGLGCHQGLFKTSKRVLRHFYVAVPTPLVRNVISQCLNCARKEKFPASNLKTHREKMNSPRANFPLETIYLDHFGPLNPLDGRFKACLKLRDGFTGYVWIFPVPDLTAKTVSEILEKRLFTHFWTML